MRIKSFVRLAAVLFVFTLAVAGCGSSNGASAPGGAGGSSSTAPTQTVHFAKTKFVLHVGLAFGAFHRYIYKPLRAGVFAKPFSHKAALVKAALATAFIIHELKIAYIDAQSSSTLTKLLSPLTDLKARATAMVAGLKAGHYDRTQIGAAQSDVTSIASQAASVGTQVRDLPVPAF